MSTTRLPAPRAAARVRRFNRFYTRRLGLLEAKATSTRRSRCPRSRVLYEVAHRERPTAAAIAAALGLDAGYLSRLLRGLRQRGLLAARAVAHDRRQRDPRAHRARAPDVRRPRCQGHGGGGGNARGALGRQERDRLLASLETVETLLGGARRGPAGKSARRRPHRARWMRAAAWRRAPARRPGLGGAAPRRAVRRRVRMERGLRAAGGPDRGRVRGGGGRARGGGDGSRRWTGAARAVCF